MTLMQIQNVFLALLTVIGLGISSAEASLSRTPQEATPSTSSTLGINRSNLSSPYATAQHITGVTATADPTYTRLYTTGISPSATTPMYVQGRPNFLLSAGSFLFDFFTGKGNQSFSDQFFSFLGSRIFSPIKSSFGGLAGNYGGMGNFQQNGSSAVATMANPYATLQCPTGNCDPYAQFRTQNATQDVFNYLQRSNQGLYTYPTGSTSR